MTTTAALITRAAARFKDPNFRVFTQAQWGNLMNQAYNRANGKTPLWPWNESTERTVNVPDTGTVGTVNNRAATLPGDVYQVNWAYDVTDDYRLVPQEGRGDQWHQDHLRSEVGQPVTYRIRNNQIELFPTPNVLTTVAMECLIGPTELAVQAVVNYLATGGAAGDITVTGIAVGDTLVSVIGVKDSDQSEHDFTSEFSITAANKINNVGGTSSAGYHLAVTTYQLSATASPVWPTQFHDLLVEGALAYAYLDTGSTEQYTAHLAAFDAGVTQMMNQLLFARTETNVPIRDVMWS